MKFIRIEIASRCKSKITKSTNMTIFGLRRDYEFKKCLTVENRYRNMVDELGSSEEAITLIVFR